jgi:hypothetical protein
VVVLLADCGKRKTVSQRKPRHIDQGAMAEFSAGMYIHLDSG